MRLILEMRLNFCNHGISEHLTKPEERRVQRVGNAQVIPSRNRNFKIKSVSENENLGQFSNDISHTQRLSDELFQVPWYSEVSGLGIPL